MFNKNKAKKDGRQNKCRICAAKIAKTYYLSNKENHLKSIYHLKREKIAKNREKILEILNKNPCSLCGENDIRVLEFDHVQRESKKSDVGKLVEHGYSWKTILSEIEKCRILCSNCHSKITHEQNNSWKHREYIKRSLV